MHKRVCEFREVPLLNNDFCCEKKTQLVIHTKKKKKKNNNKNGIFIQFVIKIVIFLFGDDKQSEILVKSP